MTKKRDENRSGVIEDEYGNKISRTAVNAKLVSHRHFSFPLITFRSYSQYLT